MTGTDPRAGSRTEGGFTLGEVMIVVLIIGILLAVAIPTFVGARDKAHDVAALSHLNTAATSAVVVGDVGNNFSLATADLLNAAEPSLMFLIGTTASTDPYEISVDPSTPGQWTAVVESGSGRCLAIMLTSQGRQRFESTSCAANSASSTTPLPTTTAPATTTTAPTTTTTTAPATTLPSCSVISIDSFQQASYTWAFQLRNTTSGSLDFEFVIPAANYELTNLAFSGSGQNMALEQASNGDGTFELTISGTLPAYQSAGGEQPNGFNGTVNPTSGQPFVRCQ